MTKKSDILADRYTNIILNEVRGISFEVREWATIIKNVIDAQYKIYWDDYLERQRAKWPSYNNQYAGRTGYGYGFFEPITPKSNKITEQDLAAMDQFEVDRIIDDIIMYHELDVDEAMNLNPKEVVDYYNKIDKSNNWELFEDEKKEEKPVPKPTQVIINGKDYPEAYEKFSVDKWVITDDIPIEYDHLKSGYNEEHEYIVYINAPFATISEYIMIHEIKHAYQDWQRISKNYPPLSKTKEIQQIYTKDFEKYVIAHQTAGYQLTSMESVIAAYYLSSNVEITAYLESVYDDLKTGKTDLFNILYTLGKNMINFKTTQVEPYTTPKGLQKKWKKIIEDYDIPLFRKFKNVFDFLNYSEKQFHKRGRKIVNKIDKLRTL